MSEKDYLDPTQVHTLFLPRTAFYIANGQQDLTYISFKFLHDESKNVIGMEATTDCGGEKVKFREGEISIEKMTELLIHCTTNTVHLTTLEPIKSIIASLEAEVLRTLETSEEPLVRIGDGFDYNRVDGRITTQSKDIPTVFGKCNFKVSTAGASSPGKISVKGTISLAMHLSSPMVAEKALASSQEHSIVKIITEEGMGIEIHNCAISETKEKGVFLEIPFEGKGLTLKQYKRIPKIVLLPDELIGQKGTSDRMGSVLLEGTIEKYLKEQRERFNITAPKSKQDVEHLQGRFARLFD